MCGQDERRARQVNTGNSEAVLLRYVSLIPLIIIIIECIDFFIAASQFRISLRVKGYDFYLDLTPVRSAGENEEEAMPPHLELAQGEMKVVSDSAKATISKGTALQEMIGWLLRTHGQMTEQVKRDASTFQEQGRLSGNLEENMNEARRAKEMSLEYRKQAGEVFTEVAQLAGASV